MSDFDLSEEWVERERPPTIQLDGEMSRSGSLNVLSAKSGPWLNAERIASNDLFKRQKTTLEDLFQDQQAQRQERSLLYADDGLSVVEEADSEDGDRDAHRQLRPRPPPVRTADGMVANFSFPARLQDGSAAETVSRDEAIRRSRSEPNMVDRAPSPDVVRAASDAPETPPRHASSARSSPSKSPLKLFQNDMDTFTADRMSRVLGMLGGRSTHKDDGDTQKTNESELTDSGPTRKRVKTHEPVGSITTQNFMNNADNIMARMRQKGGLLGKGLPRISEGSSAGSTNRRASSFGERKRSVRIQESRDVAPPLARPAERIESTTSKFSDWTSDAGRTASRYVSDALTEPLTEPLASSTVAPSINAPSTSTKPASPRYHNIPPHQHATTMRMGDMIYSRQRQEWMHVDEYDDEDDEPRPTSRRSDSPRKESHRDDESVYPHELDLSESVSYSRDSWREQTPQRTASALVKVSEMMPEHEHNWEEQTCDITFSEMRKTLSAAVSRQYEVGMWETVTHLDLRNAGLSSVQGLREMCPMLVDLDISGNAVCHLDDLPAGLQVLCAGQNELDSMTSFAHLTDLRALSLDGNKLQDFSEFGRLAHLRHLSVRDNKIDCLDGLDRLSNLLHLDLSGNALERVDFGLPELFSLENLDLSRNALTAVDGLTSLVRLVTLDVSHNALTELSLAEPAPQLRVLKASDNKLTGYDATLFPRLRVLYLDDNRITSMAGDGRPLKHIERVSLRRNPIAFDSDVQMLLREVSHLYLGGCPLGPDFRVEHRLLSLKYLELAGCRLRRLPADLADRCPNLRVLNVAHNALTEISPVGALDRLERLLAPHNRLRDVGPLHDTLSALQTVRVLDLRGNPCNAGLFAPCARPAVDGEAARRGEARIGGDYFASFDSPRPSEAVRKADDAETPIAIDGEGEHWRRLDGEFARHLDARTRARREAYTACLMGTLPLLRRLDGLDVAVEGDALARKALRMSAAVDPALAHVGTPLTGASTTIVDHSAKRLELEPPTPAPKAKAAALAKYADRLARKLVDTASPAQH